MKKMFTKIAAGILSAAMLCGIGFVSAKVAKDNAVQVKAETATLSFVNVGANFSGTSNTEMSTTNLLPSGSSESYTFNYLQCKKQSNAIFLTKNTGAFFANSTPMPGAIVNIELYINSGAAAATTYHCAFSTSECTEAYTTGSTAQNITGGNSYSFANNSVTGAKYFCFSLGNANNGQILRFDVEYTVESNDQGSSKKTYDFSKIDFSSWSSSYVEHVLEYDDSIVTFASANKNTQTITDVPVTKGGNVYLVAKNSKTISSVGWTLKQWSTKAQTVTLNFSIDGGQTYSNLNPTVTSSSFEIPETALPSGTNAVRISFSSTSNQVGISSCTVEFNSSSIPTPTPTVSSVSLDKSSANMTIGGGTISLAASVTMSDSSLYNGSIIWKSSNEAVATVSNGVVTAVAAGTTSITATAGDVESDACVITVSEQNLPDDPDSLVTASKTIAEIAELYNWADSTKYTSFGLDSVVTVNTIEDGENSGKFYTSNQSWRIYLAEEAFIRISVASGYELSSISIEYTSGKGGVLSGYESGTNLSVSGSEYSIDVGGSGGNAQITSITVKYFSTSEESGDPIQPEVSFTVVCEADIFEVYGLYELTVENIPSWGVDVRITSTSSLVSIEAEDEYAILTILGAGSIAIEIDVYDSSLNQHEHLDYVIEAVYTANSYGADLLGYAHVICKEDGSTLTDDITNLWAIMEEQYDSLDASEKTKFVAAEANQNGKNVEKGAAFYDYVFAKYGTSLSLNNFANRSVASSSPAIKSLIDDASGVTTIVTVTAIASITLVGGFTLARKRKHF